MWPAVLSSFIKNNYKAIAVVVALSFVGFGVAYIKDVIHAGILAKQDAQIKTMIDEIALLKGQKTAQAQETARALDNFAKEKQKGEVAQAKVDRLIYEREHPSTVTHVSFASVAECELELKSVREKADEDAGIFIAEIKQDRIIIASCEEVVSRQKAELSTANHIISKDAVVIDKLELRVVTADKDLQKEIDKKKFWRTTTAGSVLVILGMILL